MRNKGLQSHSVLTVNGRLEIHRRRWHGPGVGSITPVDKLVEISEATVSLGVRELCGRLNGNASNFERAAENLYRAAQVRMSGELLRQVVEAEGKQVLAKVQQGVLLPGWRASECTTPEGASRVYMGVDGVMAPVVTQAEKDKRRQQVRQKRQRRGRKAQPLPSPKRGADQAYKEFKIVTFYDQDMRHRLVSTTQGNHEAAGRLMRRDARRLGLREALQKAGNVDGASWIRNQIQRQRLGLTALGLDFYHFSENVHKARRAVYGEAEPAGKRWAEGLLHEAKHEGYDRLWEHLVEWRNRWRSPAKRKAADQLLYYVSERREMIRYPEFLAIGFRLDWRQVRQDIQGLGGASRVTVHREGYRAVTGQGLSHARCDAADGKRRNIAMLQGMKIGIPSGIVHPSQENRQPPSRPCSTLEHGPDSLPIRFFPQDLPINLRTSLLGRPLMATLVP